VTSPSRMATPAPAVSLLLLPTKVRRRPPNSAGPGVCHDSVTVRGMRATAALGPYFFSIVDEWLATHSHCPLIFTQVSVHRYVPLASLPFWVPLSVSVPMAMAVSP